MKNFNQIRHSDASVAKAFALAEEIQEAKVTDNTKVKWSQVNRAMVDAGMSPKDIMKVLSALSRKM